MATPAPLKRSYRFGLFEADPVSGELLRLGVRVRLQDQPFRLLCLLLERAGELVTREELRQALWPADTYVEFDGSLGAALKKLRSALGDSSENPIFIETLPKRGYRFLAPVNVKETPSAAALATASPSSSDSSPKDRTGLPMAGLGQRVATSAVALLGLALLTAVLYPRFHHRPSTSADLRASAITPRRSMAVLGFANTSGRTEDAWLSTALSEMLSTELAAGDELRLVPGEEIAQLQRAAPWTQTGSLTPETTSRIGTSLDSDLLVFGSYTSVGSPGHRKLRVDVRLQDANSGNVLAEAAESGNEEELFRLASEVGNKLRNSLGLSGTTVIEQANALASTPSNTEAVQFYSLGLVKVREYDYLAARGLFEQATKADAKFPLAYSMLARTDKFLGHDDLAKAEAKRAYDLAGGLSRVKKIEVEAGLDEANAEREKAAENYRVLFNLFPDSLDYGLQLAKLQLESYHPDEALETIRQLRQLPPPARDDPRLDLRQAATVIRKDLPAATRLFQSASAKAMAEGKRLVYASAQKSLCYVNEKHLPMPPECREAYEIFLAAGNRNEAGSCLQLMGEMNRLTGQDQEAIPLYEQAARMFRESGDRENLGVALNNLSLILENEGQWKRAEQTYREAQLNFQTVHDKANTAVTLGNIANILVLRGHLHEAGEMCAEAWELADASGRVRSEFAHIQHASLLLTDGEIHQALPEIESQITTLRAYGGDPWQLASALSVLGDIRKAQDELDGASKNYHEALEILTKANSPATGAQVSLAELSLAEGHAAAAEAPLRAALEQFEKEKSAGEEIGAYTSLSRALLLQGKVAEARESIARAFRQADVIEFPQLDLPLQLLQAQTIAGAAKPGTAGNTDRSTAAREIRAVIQKAHQLGFYPIECEARLALGTLEIKSNSSAGRSRLKELADDSRSRGFLRIAQQATDLAATGTTVIASAGNR